MPLSTWSLRWRLVGATLVALAVALALAGVLLAGLFRDHVLRQFTGTLASQLDQITARIEFDASGAPRLDPQTLSDPRWTRPYSGLYWQVDAMGPAARRAVLRSRSLWDSQLAVPEDTPPDGALHVHAIAGPAGTALHLVERTVRQDGAANTGWRILVAADLGETEAAVAGFNRVLAASLAVLLGLMVAAAWVQVRLGLAPLRALEASLARVRDGRSQRLEGRFPSELQPLVDDFNKVLDRNAEVVTRARTQAGNLAHAIKTPLAALAQAARPAQPPAELASLVRDQVELARRHVDWHLARSRAAAAQGVPGAVVPLEPVVQGLLRTLERVHADRHLDMRWTPPGQELRFAGETQDLQEMLGNLLDNACKWARGAVEVDAQRLAGDGRDWLVCRVDDDGPGIAPELRDRVTARGTRLDESVPGSGLGLAIVQEIAGLYGGSLALDVAPAGGLRAVLRLPAA